MYEIIYFISFLFLILAALADLLVPVVIGKKYPGYNHFIDTISTLGTKKSPVQKYECINLIVAGILLIVFSIGQLFLINPKNWAVWLYTAGVILFGIGSVFAGIYEEDVKGVAETIRGKIHGIASGIGFLFLVFAPLWAVWIKAFENLIVFNIIMLILGFLTFVLFLVSDNKTYGFLRYTGLFQRINLIILYGVLVINFCCVMEYLANTGYFT
jgi:hypothetical protein